MTFKQLQAKLGRPLDPADWRQTEHGGWIEKTAHVAPTARVAEDAAVFGDARVFDNAWVFDNARVYGHAQVFDNAWVYGEASVCGDSRVYGGAHVGGKARIEEGEIDFGDWASVRARRNLKAELEADLEESSRRLTT